VRDHRKAKAIAKGIAKAKPHQKAEQKQKRFIDNKSHMPRDVWRTTWNKAIAKSAIGWLPRTHDLRHANATQLLKNGVDVHEVKERLGHQSIKTTERYLHRLRSHQSKASESANDYLE
jgi:site-specific recombinase XerD